MLRDPPALSADNRVHTNVVDVLGRRVLARDDSQAIAIGEQCRAEQLIGCREGRDRRAGYRPTVGVDLSLAQRAMEDAPMLGTGSGSA